jgi:hypothetical protein
MVTTKIPTVTEVLEAYLPAVKEIINELERPFDTYSFIKAFKKELPTAYAMMLSRHKTAPETKVHSQVGLFLLRNQAKLNIQFLRKEPIVNVFGRTNQNAIWT